MPATRRELYDDAVRKLNKYSPSVSKADYISLLLSGDADLAATSQSDSKTQSSQKFSKIANLFTDIINGGSYTIDVINSINDFLSSNNVTQSDLIGPIRQFLRITLPNNLTVDQAGKKCGEYGLISGMRSFGQATENGVVSGQEIKPGAYDKNGSTGFYTLDQAGFLFSEDENPANKGLKPTKQNPHVTVIELLDSRIGHAVRDTAGLSIFSSMIPTHIASRAVPYVSVSVITSGSSPSNGGQPAAGDFNMIRYLTGRSAVGSFQKNMQPLMQLENETQKPGGMELFTSPQTLVSNLDDILDPNLFPIKPVDRFRPLMTLNSLSINVVPAGAGMMSYKNATMNVTLHDRGRLGEIAPLVQPGAYKDTEIEIEYGWSVDPGSKNANVTESGDVTGFALQDDVFAQLLDSMRCRERFGVVNSSFSFDDAGQANIVLVLFTKSAYELRSLDISSSESKGVASKLKSAIKDVKQLISDSPGVANFISEALIDAGTSAEGSISIDEKKLKDLKNEISNLRGSRPSKGSLSKVLDALGGVITTAENFKTTSEEGVGKIVNELKNGIEIFPPTAAIASSGNSIPKWEDYKKGSVSLGRVILHTVAKTLARTGKFDEIQLVFGKINSRAAKVRNLSMAAFPLAIDKLEADLKKLYKEKLNVSFADLIGIIGASHVSNVAYEAYGFSGQYKDGELKQGAQNQIDQILVNCGINDASFVLPKLYIHVECVPASFKSKIGPAGGTILRLFIGDSQCTPHEGYTELVNSARTDSSFLIDPTGLSEIKNFEFKEMFWADLDPSSVDSRTAVIKKLIKDKKITTVGKTLGDAEFDLSKLFSANSPQDVKRFMSEGLPTIRYGNGAGMIKNISLTSISDPALATINIIAADEKSDDKAGNTKKKGLPMIVTPTEVSVDMLGCSLINFGQSVYIDFGTGTTIDNIYACVGVNHNFSPGEFTTNAKFVINVGAYGIYNSISRQLKLTAAQAKEANGFGVLTLVTKRQENKPYTWGDLGCNEGGLALSVIQDPQYKDDASFIRVWSTVGSPETQFKKSFGEGYTNIEIVVSESLDISALITSETSGDVCCYEIAYPSFKKNAKVVNAKKYQKIDNVLTTTPVKIDLKNLK